LNTYKEIQMKVILSAIVTLAATLAFANPTATTTNTKETHSATTTTQDATATAPATGGTAMKKETKTTTHSAGAMSKADAEKACKADGVKNTDKAAWDACVTSKTTKM
jgi:hypothetical protein